MMIDRNNETRVITEFPHKVREIEHVWVPMSDGTRLSARIWMPRRCRGQPCSGDPGVHSLSQARRHAGLG